MTLRGIIKLSPAEALRLREKVAAGDREAARDWVLYSTWRQIDARRDYTPRIKTEVLRAFADHLVIQWPQTI
jgi:hypothetical protein